MPCSEPCIDRERRGFVGLALGVPLAGAGSLLAAVLPLPAAAAAPAPAPPRHRGYRPSAHTARYYDSLRY